MVKGNGRSNKTMVDGILFDSKPESEYYLELMDQISSGEIKSFEMQKTYELQPKFLHPTKKTAKGKACVVRAIKFTPDFIIELNDGSYMVVDVKGYRQKDKDRDFNLRAKLFTYRFSMPVYTAIFDRKSKAFVEKLV